MNKKNLLYVLSGFIIILLIGIIIVYDDEEQERDNGELAESDTRETELDTSLSVEERVENLLSRMTLEEKIGQMVQGEITTTRPKDVKDYYLGSILNGGGSTVSPNTPEKWLETIIEYQNMAGSTRLGIPIIYGIDAVHGNNNVYGATIFPHNIGLGATRDKELVKRIGEVTAMEVSTTGMHWNFAPVLAIPQDERWGRTYEGYGESKELVTELSVAYLEGIQGVPSDKDFMHGTKIIGTAKHWVGDGATTGGIDQGNIILTEEELQYHIEPYISAIEAGARTVMVSYTSWNGLKTHGDHYLVTEVLKGDLGFDGLVVSDWNAHEQVHPEYEEAVKQSVLAGVDLFMVPDSWKEFIDTLTALVEADEVPISRIDDAVTRILRVKMEARLFEEPFPDETLMEEGTFGSEEHREVAREAVRKSQVLLKNEGDILPLSKDMDIFVAGIKGDDIGYQSGGWTIDWQGSPGNITPGTTILEGIKNIVSDDSIITYSEDGVGAEGHDVAIVVIGEEPYAEMFGDADDLKLSEEDMRLLQTVQQTDIPMVVILLSGRPLIITDEIEHWDAFIASWLPGTEGHGVADVLFGDYPFSGELSMTWPKSMEQIPIHFEDDDYDPLFPYGFGLKTD
ncbi:glycoside hydrolase family 3 protein [Evansella tamaricis]|uniref:beta-glucosidase n=1 Tax=Evansella tamaricis TaxID=2069301 RepID=A0ABS6JJY9_9BACI|nr:glycoside hydrolase family 3 N-terminal domain-containing protein [Evansella tamaricis]MBU9714001.1 glycoside hydrolase family 3 C-terminal domain-containing protein [Evansella tamaricis]